MRFLNHQNPDFPPFQPPTSCLQVNRFPTIRPTVSPIMTMVSCLRMLWRVTNSLMYLFMCFGVKWWKVPFQP